MERYWIVKGVVTDEDSYDGKASLGDTEWQFSDGPSDERGWSRDFLSLEEGLACLSPAIFYWEG